jgi:hypothetical protein
MPPTAFRCFGTLGRSFGFFDFVLDFLGWVGFLNFRSAFFLGAVFLGFFFVNALSRACGVMRGRM